MDAKLICAIAKDVPEKTYTGRLGVTLKKDEAWVKLVSQGE